MNPAVDETPGWSRTRWAVSITIVVATQLALVVGFSNRQPVDRRTTTNTTVNLPTAVPAELQALTDPTLLALGGPRSFSAIWLAPSTLPPVDARWKSAPQWLALETDSLGASFVAFARTNLAPVHGLAFRPPPRTTEPEQPLPLQPLRRASSLEITGALQQRSLLTRPELRSWPATDLLQPSEVRVLVDQRGIVLSAILQTGSGLAAADASAVEQAKQLRFEPDRSEPTFDTLTLGLLRFHWHATPK
jgi:hypothetical protein